MHKLRVDTHTHTSTEICLKKGIGRVQVACFLAGYNESRAWHFRYFLIFSIIKMIFLHFYQIYYLFLHQSYLKSPLPVKLTWKKMQNIIFYHWKNEKIPNVPSSDLLTTQITVRHTQRARVLPLTQLWSLLWAILSQSTKASSFVFSLSRAAFAASWHMCAHLRRRRRRRGPGRRRPLPASESASEGRDEVPPKAWINENNNNSHNNVNPFLPTGQFLAPKLIILIILIDILFFSVVLMFLYVEQDVNLA